MPTGYTEVLFERDQPFRDFVLRCARGIGYLADMRDKPLDAPIEASAELTLGSEWLSECQRKHEWLTSLSDAEVSAMYEEEFACVTSSIQKSNASTYATRMRLKDMRLQVQDWKPPTDDHRELKGLMLQQLDAAFESCQPIELPKRMDPKAWHAEQIDRVTESWRRESERIANRNRHVYLRNKWIAELKASLT